MKPLVLYVMASVALSLPPCMAADTLVTAPVPKPTFAMKHPKLHAIGRKIRRTCQVLLPVVEFCGSAAQIVTAIR